MDLQLASDAMIQVTKPLDEAAKALYRPVRVIGLVKNIDKAEKLIKAFMAFVDVGVSSLLFKDYDESMIVMVMTQNMIVVLVFPEIL
ncbi:hypothetical protein DCAR_0415598 [Daucus carota subsp. sativus]|uniref:Uncharacterized protein n=1 Tax=Daucus carota subsp. sativus TaxID=79200 RepID=A0A165WHH7_DAUCS|nr:hypothetical protein DCAR_0415598 [Daucus carota subsp. sativus]